MAVPRSDYIRISKALIIKLYKLGCWGNGSLYEDNLKDGFPSEEKHKVLLVAEALVRQGVLIKIPKKYGMKYYLNKEKREKIEEIKK